MKQFSAEAIVYINLRGEGGNVFLSPSGGRDINTMKLRHETHKDGDTFLT